jgi:hypothetical protein
MRLHGIVVNLNDDNNEAKLAGLRHHQGGLG